MCVRGWSQICDLSNALTLGLPRDVINVIYMEYIELYILNQPRIYLCPFYSMLVIMYIGTNDLWFLANLFHFTNPPLNMYGLLLLPFADLKLNSDDNFDDKNSGLNMVALVVYDPMNAYMGYITAIVTTVPFYQAHIKWHLSVPCGNGPQALQYIPRNMHTVLLCFALLWLCNRS